MLKSAHEPGIEVAAEGSTQAPASIHCWGYLQALFWLLRAQVVPEVQGCSSPASYTCTLLGSLAFLSVHCW